MRPLRARPPRAIALLPLLGLVFAAGCGETGAARAFNAGEGANEGIRVPLDGVRYEVFVTRELNLADPEDKQYYQGRPAPPGSALFGVFIRACGLPGAKGTPVASGNLRVTNIRGQVYRPLPLKPDNVFAYKPGPLRPGECQPNQASATAYAPTGGALVLFRFPVVDMENRPFMLEIQGRPPAPGQPSRVARFQLDL